MLNFIPPNDYGECIVAVLGIVAAGLSFASDQRKKQIDKEGVEEEAEQPITKQDLEDAVITLKFATECVTQAKVAFMDNTQLLCLLGMAVDFVGRDPDKLLEFCDRAFVYMRHENFSSQPVIVSMLEIACDIAKETKRLRKEQDDSLDKL
jgi:hypothetical protein